MIGSHRTSHVETSRMRSSRSTPGRASQRPNIQSQPGSVKCTATRFLAAPPTSVLTANPGGVPAPCQAGHGPTPGKTMQRGVFLCTAWLVEGATSQVIRHSKYQL